MDGWCQSFFFAFTAGVCCCNVCVLQVRNPKQACLRLDQMSVEVILLQKSGLPYSGPALVHASLAKAITILPGSSSTVPVAFHLSVDGSGLERLGRHMASRSVGALGFQVGKQGFFCVLPHFSCKKIRWSVLNRWWRSCFLVLVHWCRLSVSCCVDIKMEK